MSHFIVVLFKGKFFNLVILFFQRFTFILKFSQGSRCTFNIWLKLNILAQFDDFHPIYPSKNNACSLKEMSSQIIFLMRKGKFDALEP